MTDAIANKKIVRDFYESYNAKNLDDTWKRFIATNLSNHALGGAYDGNAWREMDKGLFGGFADFSLQVLDQVAEGDKVATRYTLGGTHTGEFAGIPASGAVTRLTATSVDRVANGKIVEHWTDADVTGFMQALAQPAKSPAKPRP
jgi:predicted ester cyclase